MYKEHFGLQRALFEGGIAREEGVFLGPRQQLVIANLKIALTTRDSIATLAGPVGVGKTTLASQAMRIAATRLALAWVSGAPLSADEILELLLAEFDFTPYGMGRVERLQTWRQFITEMNATDTRICILVENAQTLGPAALQALGPLTSADPNGCPGVNLVIMGEPGLYEFFENPALAELGQRIRSRQRVDPLNPAEVEAYLRCRTSAAGGDFDAIFAPGAGPILHRYTAGVPRVIDNVCETALALAAAAKQPRLTPADLVKVAERMYGLAPIGPVPTMPKHSSAPAPEATPAAAQAQPKPQAAQSTTPPVVTPPSEPEVPAAVVDGHESEPPVVEPEPTAQADASMEVEPDEEAPAVPALDLTPDPVEPPTLTEVVDEPTMESAQSPAEEITEGEIEAAIAEAERAAIEAEAPAQVSEDVPELIDEAPEPVPEPAIAEKAVPDPEPDHDSKLAQTLAEAKSIEDISNSMAEALFADEDIDMLAAALDAAVPGAAARRESPVTGLSPEETSAVLQLSEDSSAEPEEATEPDPAPVPPAEAAS